MPTEQAFAFAVFACSVKREAVFVYSELYLK